MCGIAGILRTADEGATHAGPLSLIPEDWLDLLDRGIRHRGPDGHGRLRIAHDGAHIALVHRRLSILDHEGGRQPMTCGPEVAPVGAAAGFASSDEPINYAAAALPRLAIVFNGCLYNHVQIRRDAMSRGREFSTSHSDTESILHAVALDGERAFDRFDGMYALAALDLLQGRVFLARDRHGEKPLYLLSMHDARAGHLRAFASSPAPLARLRSRITNVAPRRAIEMPILQEWICRGWSGSTPFTQITEVQPGESLRIDLRSGEVLRSRLVSHVAMPRRRDADLSALDLTLVQSVRSRLDADVPMGCFLSGGVDSAVVAAIASRFRPDIPAFTVRMPDPELDESAAAVRTAKALNLNHSVLDCETDFLADLTRMIEQLLLPLGDSSLLPTFWVSREARRVVTVALTGDGGDELFLGYDRHRAARVMPLLRRLKLQRLAGWLSWLDASRGLNRGVRLLQAVAADDYTDLVRVFPAALAGDLGMSVSCGRVPIGSSGDVLEAAREWDLREYLPFDLMRKVDTATMSVALESRAPLLSSGLSAIAGGLSAATLRRGGSKGLLKRVAARHLPPEVLSRPKRGFAIPIGRWFREDRGGVLTALRDLQSSGDSVVSNLPVHAGKWRQLVEDHASLRADHAQRLYQMLVLELWWRAARG